MCMVWRTLRILLNLVVILSTPLVCIMVCVLVSESRSLVWLLGVVDCSRVLKLVICGLDVACPFMLFVNIMVVVGVLLTIDVHDFLTVTMATPLPNRPSNIMNVLLRHSETIMNMTGLMKPMTVCLTLVLHLSRRPCTDLGDLLNFDRPVSIISGWPLDVVPTVCVAPPSDPGNRAFDAHALGLLAGGNFVCGMGPDLMFSMYIERLLTCVLMMIDALVLVTLV